MPLTSSGDVDAVLTAFDQAPMMLSLCEGDDLELTAVNALARVALGNHPSRGEPDTGGNVSSITDDSFRGVAQRLHDVVRTGEPFVGTHWRVEVEDVDGRPAEAFLDFILHPCFWPDGSIRGVITSATDVTETALVRHGERARRVAGDDVVPMLQDALLPEGLPVIRGVQLGARYLLADDAGSAGGDWFDAVALDDGRVVLVVGDVVGAGVTASAVMGELRAVFEERARVDGDIVEALRLLEARARRTHAARAATVCAAVLEPETGWLTYCTAGHPPPLVVTAGGVPSLLPVSGAAPLGFDRPLSVARHRLEEGDLLLLYSDGLVERPTRSRQQGSEELCEAVARTCARGRRDGDAHFLVDRVCAEAAETLTRTTGYSDDITLLAAQRVPPADGLDVVLPATPEALGLVRNLFAEWIALAGASRIDESAMQHSLGELVSNVIEHAYAPDAPRSRSMVEIHARHGDGGVIETEVVDHGSWRPPRQSPSRGRGLAMARGFSDEMGLQHGDDGTRARLRHHPRRHVEMLTPRGPPAPPAAGSPLQVRHLGGTLQLCGAVDRSSVDVLRHRLARVTHGGTRGVRIDLSEVTALSSAGVQVLFEQLGDGCGLELVAPAGSPAQQVLDLVQLPYVPR